MKKIIHIILEIVLFIAIITFGINLYMVKTTEDKIVSINDIKDSYDAILVLGCKVEGNSPSIMLEKRLNKAVEVYNKINTKLLISGDHGQNEYDEINVMKNYLLDMNINSNDIFQDHAGFSTYDSIYRAKNIFGAKKIVIVTQRYHMYRALYLAKALDLDAIGVISEDVPYKEIMIKNEIREVLSRCKNFVKAIIKPESKYLGNTISLDSDGNITNG